MTKPLALVEPVEQVVDDSVPVEQVQTPVETAVMTPVATPVAGRPNAVPKMPLQQQPAVARITPQTMQEQVVASNMSPMVPNARTSAQARKMELSKQ